MSRDPLEYISRSDIGLVRGRNEDAVAVYPDLGLVVVADGMGGANSGDVASRLATDVVSGRFRHHTPARNDGDAARLFLETTVEEANVAVWEWAQSHEECGGMGTTVVAGFFGRNWLAVAHVGDSRLYLMRDGELAQVTRDHSFIQEVVDQGFFRSVEEAKDYGIGGNILTRALGTAAEVRVSCDLVDTRPGDLFLFCTDGLNGMVPDEWLEQILKLGGEKDLGILATTLIEVACDRGGIDNITLALVRVARETA
jgi:PPM family protein phosphatase